MKVAIVGSGISGLVAAHRLAAANEVTVFEAGSHVGGHTNTVDVGGRAVDTGFIVFNDRTYPHFIALLAELGVASKASTMSFSVRCERTGVEWGGHSLGALLAQPTNALRPSFLRMLRDVLRFNREAPALLGGSDATTLGEFLTRGGYSKVFLEHYLIPMGASIWSADPGQFLDFPARFFVQFFSNHGMITVYDHPQWRVVTGGSRSYVGPLTQRFADRIRLECPVQQVRRLEDRVEISSRAGVESFDRVVLACHSDQALALLADPSAAEREVLGALPYQENEAVLHTDASLLPRARRAWSGWNYHVLRESTGRVAVTYCMNILQGFEPGTRETYCVTLNRAAAVDPAKVLRRIVYHHPVFTRAGVAAQARRADVSGRNRTHYAGAYWGFGFHEDGVKSGLQAAAELGA